MPFFAMSIVEHDYWPGHRVVETGWSLGLLQRCRRADSVKECCTKTLTYHDFKGKNFD